MTADPFAIAADLLEAEGAELTQLGHFDWTPEPYQAAPEGDWDWWLFNAGRGSGKTDTAAYWLDQHVNGPPCMVGLPGGHRPAIIAPTLGDAVESCVNGPSGLRAHDPAIRLVTRKGGTFVEWPNGATAKVFGAFTPEDVERLRAGGNRCCAWLEEFAAWRYLEQCWDHTRFGLRVGPRPKGVITTTPKNRPLVAALLSETPPVNVAVTRIEDDSERGWRYPNMDDNPHLAEHVRAELLRAYGGTRLGEQELRAELLETIEGALWTPAMIEPYRIDPALNQAEAQRVIEQLRRIVVAVDPSWGTKGDEVGIGVAGLGYDGRGYILEDASGRFPPLEWGAKAVDRYRSWRADRILAEVNFQAEQVRLVMQTVDPTVPVKEIRVTRGKELRAEPVLSLYEQGRVSHVGRFAGLEEQQMSWVPPGHENASEFSPDRVDWLVMALTELMLDAGGPLRTASPAAARIPKVKPPRT